MVWRSRPASDASQQETRKNKQILNHVSVFKKKKTIDGVTFPPRQAKAAISRAVEIGWIMLLFFFFLWHSYVHGGFFFFLGFWGKEASTIKLKSVVKYYKGARCEALSTSAARFDSGSGVRRQRVWSPRSLLLPEIVFVKDLARAA